MSFSRFTDNNPDFHTRLSFRIDVCLFRAISILNTKLSMGCLHKTHSWSEQLHYEQSLEHCERIRSLGKNCCYGPKADYISPRILILPEQTSKTQFTWTVQILCETHLKKNRISSQNINMFSLFFFNWEFDQFCVDQVSKIQAFKKSLTISFEKKINWIWETHGTGVRKRDW